MSERRKRDNAPPIQVVVVEYHQHALEHIHSILRRRSSLKPWSMLHFDAHPDLACPSDHVPAISCFLPRQNDENLYELLDSHSSGIAEWILPLVLAGGLEHIHWIKPSESQQLPIGKHEYHVGAWIPPAGSSQSENVIESFLDLPCSARVRVDWRHSYYLDDASVVDADELLLAKKLQLTVSELPVESENEREVADEQTTPITQLSFDKDWALDICLDYFCCRNPFVTDIEAIDETFAATLVNVVTSTRMQTASSGDSILEPLAYKRELARFQSSFQQLLRDKDDASIAQLLHFYESEDEARILFEKLLESLSSNPDDSATLETMAMEALSNLCLPHDSKRLENDVNESIRQRVETMHHALQQTKQSPGGDPLMITIARSTLDGFTPESVVEKLQDDVLASIHQTFCGCDLLCTHSTDSIRPELFSLPEASTCRLNVIFDYDEWEGSTVG